MSRDFFPQLLPIRSKRTRLSLRWRLGHRAPGSSKTPVPRAPARGGPSRSLRGEMRQGQASKVWWVIEYSSPVPPAVPPSATPRPRPANPPTAPPLAPPGRLLLNDPAAGRLPAAPRTTAVPRCATAAVRPYTHHHHGAELSEETGVVWGGARPPRPNTISTFLYPRPGGGMGGVESVGQKGPCLSPQYSSGTTTFPHSTHTDPDLHALGRGHPGRRGPLPQPNCRCCLLGGCWAQPTPVPTAMQALNAPPVP